MEKTLYYTYLGNNGSIQSIVELEGVPNVKHYLLRSENGKVITKDGINFFTEIFIPYKDLENWYEIHEKGQK